MKVIFKICLLLFLFILNSFKYLANEISSNKIAIKLDIVARDSIANIRFNNINFQDYFVTITLTNTQDTNISITTMTCSWGDSFITNDKSVSIESQQCDSNIPETIEIKAHKSVTFFGRLRTSIKMKSDNLIYFKIGFADMPLKEFIFPNYPDSNIEKQKFPIYWSDDVLLEDEFNKYKLEK